MGFFSSIGKVLGGVGGALLGGTTGGALLGIGGNLLSGLLQNRAYSQASNAANQATNDSNYLLASMYEQQRKDDEPFRAAAAGALSRLTSMPSQNFTYDQLWADPSYSFRLNEGLKGVSQSAAAKGLLNSGDTAKAMNDYAQNAASEEYASAYSRFADQQDRQWNRDSQLAGLGASALQSSNTLASTVSRQQSGNLMQSAGMRASSYIGRGNALADILKGL